MKDGDWIVLFAEDRDFLRIRFSGLYSYRTGEIGLKEYINKYLDRYSKRDYYPWHMPGHKRQDVFADDFWEILFRRDFTEAEGLDDLHEPELFMKDSLEQMRRFYGTEKTYMMVNGATKELMLGVYGADFPYDEYKAEMSALFHEQAAGGKLPMKPGVTGLLQTLKKNGRKVALASSTRKAVVEQELRDAGILPYFDRVICGDMVKRSKPEPDIYLEACRQIHVMPEQAYAIEDSYNGIRSAHAAGLHPIMVPDLAPVTEEMQELSDVILDSLTEVEKYLFFI